MATTLLVFYEVRTTTVPMQWFGESITTLQAVFFCMVCAEGVGTVHIQAKVTTQALLLSNGE
jgi:hypothetical protein